MKKFWRGFRGEADKNAREDKARIKQSNSINYAICSRLAATKRSQNIVNS
jgi:hypothetical protein